MKKRYTILATAFAMALIVASPMTAITSHALGLNIDAYDDTDYGTMPDNYWDSNDSDSSYNEPSTPSAPASAPVENTGSYDSSFSSSGSSGSSSSNSGSSSTTVNNANNVVVSVTGGQQFRNVMNKEHTSYQVYHCGDSKVTFEVTDAEGNVVAYKTVKLEKGEDGLWYENITFADDVDVKDFTLNVTKGDATYLSTLGVSGIKINGTVVLSTVPAEIVPAEAVIGHRYCSCGASFDIYENSGIDKDAWSAHAREHAAKGESARWTDK